MTVVIDASVILRWLIPDPAHSAETERASQLMAAAMAGEFAVLQPAHWLLEVGSALTHLSPDTAADDIALLAAMEWPASDAPAVLERACALALRLGRPVSDTLYHAVALETADALLVTGEPRYLRAARAEGRVLSLRAWAAARSPPAALGRE